MRFKTRHLISTIITAIYIFLQSAFPRSLSAKESGMLVSLLASFLRTDPATMSFFVRKSAHFLEFLLFGVFLALLFLDRNDSLDQDLRKICSKW